MIRTDKYTITGTGINPHYELKDFFVSNYLFETFAKHCTEQKLAAFDLQKEDKSWVVSDFFVEMFDSPLKWQDKVEIKMGFRNTKGVKVLCDFEIFNKNKKIGQATMQWIVIDFTKRRPTIHPAVSEKFITEENMPYEGFRFKPIKDAENKTTFEQKINYSLIDFNNHLNSYHYLRFAYDALDNNFKHHHYPAIFHAKFEKEIHLDDTIAIYADNKNDESHIQIKRKEGDNETGAFKLRVEWKARIL